MKTFRPFFERIATENKRMAIVFHPARSGEGASEMESILEMNDPAIIDRKRMGEDVWLFLSSPAGANDLIKRALQHTHSIDASLYLTDGKGRPSGAEWMLYDTMMESEPMIAMTTFLQMVVFTPFITSETLRKELALEIEQEGMAWLGRIGRIGNDNLPGWKSIFEEYHRDENETQ